ncbi:hypothetical protein [Sulfurovum sp.]|uniref:hypothetical protein n=1 Tax=Sulfurovum sp. TaxID=1969726 RepID=UPI002868195B|nr:hypothetical protein [Sulfurovum sp.]
MKTKTSRTFTKMIALSLMTVTLASANKPTNFGLTVNKKLASMETIYTTMSTIQLQKEVERRSKNGEVTFDMGMELIKRWSNS